MPRGLSSREENGLQSAPPEGVFVSKVYGAPGEDAATRWQELASEGYTIKSFLGHAEIKALHQLRIDTIPVVPAGFYISVFSSLETRRAILEGFKTILKDKLKTLAPGFRIVSATFVTKKGGGQNGSLELHQDSSLVDHTKELGMNVWVPLCDVDNHNGSLRVAGRSHRFNLIGCLPPLYRPHGDLGRDLISPSITSLSMKAGEACLFDTRLLHASGENHSTSDRVAAFFSLIPEDRPVRLYFRNPETPAQLDVFEVEDEFMLHLQPLHYPDVSTREAMTFLGSFDHVQQKLSEADFAALHADLTVPEAEPASAEEAVVPAGVVVGLNVGAVFSSFWARLFERFQP